MKQAIRAILVVLGFFPDQVEQDAAIVRALKKTSWFTHIFLKLPAWQEMPHALLDKRVQTAISNVKTARKKVVLFRNLWPSWPTRANKFAGMATVDDLVIPDYYRTAVHMLRDEADHLGVQCGMDAEPYNKRVSEVAQFLRGKLAAWSEGEDIRAAANAVKGQLDFVLPSDSYSPDTYPWLFAEMGKLRCSESTYRMPDGRIRPLIKPPLGMKHLIHLWGTACSLSGRKGTQTPEQVKKMYLRRSKDMLIHSPENVGIWCYVRRQELAAVLASKRWER